jgi:hypothetical protein
LTYRQVFVVAEGEIRSLRRKTIASGDIALIGDDRLY